MSAPPSAPAAAATSSLPPGQAKKAARAATGHGHGHAAARAPLATAPAAGGNGRGIGRGNGRGVNAAPPPPVAAPAAAPGPPAATPATALGRGLSAHRRSGPRISIAAPSASQPAPRRRSVTAGSNTAHNTQNGLLSASLNAANAAGSASPTLAGPLAPGTATLGPGSATASGTRTATAGATAHRPHKSGLVASAIDPAAAEIERFINVIPIGVWIALAAALALAALSGIAALRSSRRMRIQAGEVAAVTAAAVTDPLTGVLNRRGFIEAAELELGRARRYDHPVALAFVDIRGLKAVNDTEGHLAGDRLLRRVTMLLRESARTHDLVGRIGGDELAVLLAEQSAAGAAAMTQRVRAQVPAARSSLRLSTPWDVTIGTATYPEDGDTFEQLLAAADRRLYEQRGIHLT